MAINIKYFVNVHDLIEKVPDTIKFVVYEWVDKDEVFEFGSEDKNSYFRIIGKDAKEVSDRVGTFEKNGLQIAKLKLHY